MIFFCFNYFFHKGKGSLKKDFSLRNRKSKLSHSLSDILFDKSNDELSYFVLFMESIQASNYVKFLLDLNTFEQTFLDNHSTNNNSIVNNSDFSGIYFYLIDNFSYNNLILSFYSLSSDWACGWDLFQIHCKICQVYNKCVRSHHFRYNMQNMSGKSKSTCRSHLFQRIQTVRFRFNREKVNKSYFSSFVSSTFNSVYLKILWKIPNERVSLQIFDENIDQPEFEFDRFSLRWLGYRFPTRSKATFYFTCFNFFSEYQINEYNFKFLENEKASELLKFWMQAENFSRNVLNKQTSLNVRNKSEVESQFKQWQNDAMIIYDK